MTDVYRPGEFDSLANDSSIRLFGRLMWDLMLRDPSTRGDVYSGHPVLPRSSPSNFLLDQLAKEDAKLARIMSFSYQGELFDLAKPTIFLVHGDGIRAEHVDDVPPDQLTLRKRPTFTEHSGLVGQKGAFAPDIFVWIYDRADFTVRLDTETGSFDQVLLAHELGGSFGDAFMERAVSDPPARTTRRRRRRRWHSEEE